MRVIVAGSRGFDDLQLLFDCMDHLHCQYGVTAVISGKAPGADTLGERWAVSRGVPIIQKPADWDTHGKSAGYKRNVEMAELADYVVVFWDGQSKGTKHMIDIATAKGLPCWVVEYA